MKVLKVLAILLTLAASSSSQNLAMIAIGKISGGEWGTLYDSVEMINMDSESECSFKPAHFPIKVFNSVAMRNGRNEIRICGGQLNEGAETNECFAYDSAVDSWHQDGFLVDIRNGAYSNEISPGVWFIFGGTYFLNAGNTDLSRIHFSQYSNTITNTFASRVLITEYKYFSSPSN